MKTCILFLMIIGASSAESAAQVTKAWDTHHESGLQLVDYAREIKTDASGNVYIGGHSLIDEEQHGVITVVKLDSNGRSKWVYTSAQDDYMEDMAVSPAGNVYLAGNDGDAPATTDILVIKLNPDGTVAWRRTFDGPGNYSDYATALHIDAAENVYVGGNASTVINGHQFTALKYNTSGVLLWSSAFSSLVPSYQNNAFDIVADNIGNVFLSGHQKVGDEDFLTMVRFSPSGAMLWWDTTNTHHEWTEIDYVYSKTDNNGNAYLAGNIRLPGTGSDILLVKYGAAGKAWVRTWNNSGNDSNYINSFNFYKDESLAIDGSGNVFVTGSTTYPTPYMEDIVTLKYSPQGALLWKHEFNSPNDFADWPFGLALDGAGNPYICGSTEFSSAFGDVDFLTYKLNGATGTLVWTQTYDYRGNFIDEAHAIHVDGNNNVYVTGIGAATDDFIDPTSHMVIIKYRQSPAPAPSAVHAPAGPVTWTLSPNPAAEEIRAELHLDKASELSIQLLSAAGQLLLDVPGRVQPAGMQLLRLPVADLPYGKYTVRLCIDGIPHYRKILVQH